MRQKPSKPLRPLPLVLSIGYSIVLPLLIFLFIGRFLDQRFQTAPKYLLIGLGVGFLFTCLLLYLKVRAILKSSE